MDLSWHYIMQRGGRQDVGCSEGGSCITVGQVGEERKEGLSVGRSVLMNLCQSGAQSLLKLHTTPQWNWFPFDQRGEFSFPGEIPMLWSPPSSFLPFYLAALPCLPRTLFRLLELNKIIHHSLAATSLYLHPRVKTAEWTKKNPRQASLDALKFKIISQMKSLPRFWSAE